MKKNLIMRVASGLLIAVLITTFLTGRRFAKYNTVAVGTSTVLVAKYNVVGYSHVVNSDGSIGGIIMENSDGVLKEKNPFNIHNGTVDDLNYAPRNAAFDNVYLLDANGEPDPSKPANIDQSNLRNSRDSKAAPGTGGVSVLKVFNGGDVTVDILFDITSYYENTANTEAKVVEVDEKGNVIGEVDQNGNFIAKSVDSNGNIIEYNNVWLPQRTDDFSVKADFTQRFAVGQIRYYKFYWRWPYDADHEQKDTAVGIQSNKLYGTENFNNLLTYKIVFNATQVD